MGLKSLMKYIKIKLEGGRKKSAGILFSSFPSFPSFASSPLHTSTCLGLLYTRYETREMCTYGLLNLASWELSHSSLRSLILHFQISVLCLNDVFQNSANNFKSLRTFYDLSILDFFHTLLSFF